MSDMKSVIQYLVSLRQML